MHLSLATYEDLRRVIHDLCGLVLGPDKEYLVHHRLGPVVAEWGLRSFEELRDRLRAPGSAALCDDVVEAITTNETAFFRDVHPFGTIRRLVLPAIVAAWRGRRARGSSAPLRFWSAAASTGQEAYSLAILVHEACLDISLGLTPDDVEVLATDISAEALERARCGAYAERDLVRGLTPAQVARYFQPRDTSWVVADMVRRLVTFRRLNLTGPLTWLGRFDLVLCRNVLIYFDAAARRHVCGQMHAMLHEGGYLLLGSAENLFGVADGFETVRAGETLLYRKPGGPAAASLSTGGRIG